MSFTVGIDIGTTGIKAGLLNLDTMRIEHLSARPLDAGPAIHPDYLWRQTLATIQELLFGLSGAPIAAIGVAGQMHGAVFYDGSGKVLNPILTWQDRHHCDSALLESVREVIHREQIAGMGTDLACGYTGIILLWLKQCQPDFFRSIDRFTLISDFIRAKLLGRPGPVTDPTNAFGTGLLDARDSTWHVRLIRALELDLSLFPTIRPSHTPVGQLSSTLAATLGIAEVPVIAGGGDNQVGMLGSGLVGPESPLLVNIGTAAQISKIIPSFCKVQGMDTRTCFNGHAALVGASLGGGASYHWLRKELRKSLGPALDYPDLDRLAAQAPPGAGGLVYCTGPSRQDPSRPSGFSGNLSLLSDLACMARAVMEGVLNDLRPFFDILQKRFPSSDLIGSGNGLQKSPVWAQITADHFNLPLRVVEHENVVFGAALLAAHGIGLLQLQNAAASLPYREYVPGQYPTEP